MFPANMAASDDRAPRKRWFAVGRESGTGEIVQTEGATEDEAMTRIKGRAYPVDVIRTWCRDE